MNKAVIVGGSGFVGSHVADQLTDAGWEVTIYDRHKSTWLRHNQTMIVGDILDKKAIIEAVQGVDIVYNFAALADLSQALDRPIETVEINILGNVNVLEACRIHKVKRFLYASSIYVYSREGGFYRCSKQAAEHYIEEYQSTFGLDYTILRYGSLYGPRSNESNGLYKIIQGVLESGKVNYEGHPESMRDYIHVQDAAQASIVALADDFINESIVLTGPQTMRVRDMLNMVAEILAIPDHLVQFTEGSYAGHYVRTAYAYQPKLGRKYLPPTHVDFGQGLLQLIEEVRTRLVSS